MLTLIIPTYRNPKYLDLCLKSAVENKVNSNTEILVIVDGFFEESQKHTRKVS
jgi:glycosyltransferase involved in cell wall biosynthesis